MNLPSALAAESGVVCAVGAGGKKSALYALADRTDRAVVTATVRIPIFDPHVAAVQVTGEPTAAVAAADPDDWPLGLVPDRDREDRYLGYDADAIPEVKRDAPGPVLVKADGARMREFKAPGDDEPQIPAVADTVLPIASVHAVGDPLDEATVHRPERVAAITGRDLGDEIRPRDVAAVLASPEGGLRDVPADATAVPVLNKVDDEALAATAREVAAEIHERADVPRVVLTRLTADEPVVEVVE
jgi:probable selenium-dependent hydroxylase accessory protein YqeC